MKTLNCTLVILLTVLFAACSAAPRILTKELSPEEKYDLWQKASTPGPFHQKLQALIGKWDTAVTLRTEPDALAQVSRGFAECTWILGGRFVQESYHGVLAEMPFIGFGLLGYDNVLSRYVSIWADSFGTGLLVSTGEVDADAKVLTLTGSFQDPLSGATKQARTVTRIIDNDHHLFEMYETDETGGEQKSLQISYSRRVNSTKEMPGKPHPPTQ